MASDHLLPQGNASIHPSRRVSASKSPIVDCKVTAGQCSFSVGPARLRMMAVAGLQLAQDVTLERSRNTQEEAEFGTEIQVSANYYPICREAVAVLKLKLYLTMASCY